MQRSTKLKNKRGILNNVTCGTFLLDTTPFSRQIYQGPQELHEDSLGESVCLSFTVESESYRQTSAIWSCHIFGGMIVSSDQIP
jgi:hypothetical protein